MFEGDLHGEIQKMIFQETKYLRHYIGKVVDNTTDTLQTPAGRVKVQIDELGYDNQGSAFWCWPRQGHGMDVPAVGEWVEVYFLNGEARRPVYLAGVQEISGFVPAAYTTPTTHVLYQNPQTGDSLSYDEAKKEMDMVLQALKIGDGSEAFVKGSTFYTFMTNFMTWVGAHTHLPGTFSNGGGAVVGVSGGPVSAPGSLSDFRSTVVLGQ